jgi:hypothetical protein
VKHPLPLTVWKGFGSVDAVKELVRDAVCMKMKLIVLGTIFVVAFGGVSRAQLTLSAGESYTYGFDSLPFFGEGYRGAPPPGEGFARFSSTSDSQDPGDAFRVDIFENSTSETPLATANGGGTVTADATGGWQDLQGFARVTVTSGTLTFDTLTLGVYRPTPGIPGEFDFYNTVVQVPEPGAIALWSCVLVGVLYSLRQIKRQRSN